MRITSLILLLILSCTFALGKGAAAGHPSVSHGESSHPSEGARAGESSRISHAEEVPRINEVPSESVAKARSQGTIFHSEEEAVTRFQVDKGLTYQNKFESEPSVRPNWVPDKFEDHPITYASECGCYGYRGANNAWIIYALLNDHAQRARVMQQEGYIVDNTIDVPWRWVLGVIIGLLLIFIVISIVKNRKSRINYGF